MKKDIIVPKIENVLVAIVLDGESWNAHLINRSPNKLETVMVTSKGFGRKGQKEQKTSILRHMIPSLGSGETALIESIDPSVFHLNNQYWVSFFIDSQLFDKKYIFVPDSIVKQNLSFVAELNLEGVLHE